MQSQLAHAGNASATPMLFRYLPVFGLLALVIALVVAGALYAADVVADAAKDAAVVTFPQTIQTSFGWLTVGQVDKMGGLTSEDLAGMTHGIQNLVLSDKVQIQVTLQLANRSDQPIAYSPEQFGLTDGDNAEGFGPDNGTMLTGVLPAHATLDAVLDFVTPRTNQPLSLVYHDPVSAQRTLITIGPADLNAGSTPIVVPEEHPHVN
jgi:hypothetical protein